MIFQLGTYEIVVTVFVLMLSLSIHEWSHAGVAYLFGDKTAAKQGRLSLNPLVHIDLFGFLAVIFIGFGWAKPVEIHLHGLKKPVRAEILIALAGPLSNALLAFLFLFLILYDIVPMGLNIAGLDISFQLIFNLIIQINLVLFIFNMIPIPPLDGSHIILALIPMKYQYIKKKIFFYGQFLLLIVMILSVIFDYQYFPIMDIVESCIHFFVILLV